MKTTFFVLWSAGIVSTALALPYIFALQHDVLAQATLPLAYIALISIGQTALLLAVAVYSGLRLSQKVGLKWPTLFEAGVPRIQKLRKIGILAVPLGIAVALVIKLADVYFLAQLPALGAVVAQMPFWKALLVAPYGGVVEELLMRLFLMSLFAWLLGKATRTKDIFNSGTIMWTAIIGASILFGLGHLPATANILPLTPLVITRALLLNGIGGLVFGWLYWKKGLAYAIAAHFTTDIVLHAILPAVLE